MCCLHLTTTLLVLFQLSSLAVKACRPEKRVSYLLLQLNIIFVIRVREQFGTFSLWTPPPPAPSVSSSASSARSSASLSTVVVAPAVLGYLQLSRLKLNLSRLCRFWSPLGSSFSVHVCENSRVSWQPLLGLPLVFKLDPLPFPTQSPPPQ